MPFVADLLPKSVYTFDMTAYTLEPPTLRLLIGINVQCKLHSVSAVAICPIHREIKNGESRSGRPLWVLNVVQISLAPTKQSLNYTA